MKIPKLIWDEEIIDGFKTWSAPGPYTDEDGASEFDWRIRLNGGGFQENSEPELMGSEIPRIWKTLEEAMKTLEAEHLSILAFEEKVEIEEEER